ncbi:MAG: LytTR family transcriptional regulator [Eubacterium sp.]|nr:LytTR family transcriptional regulator [Eubacterium sp.]
MLDIYLFEPDKIHIEIIRKIFAEYSIKYNSDSAFKAFSEMPEIIKCGDVYGSETSLYMIRGNDRINTLAVSISEINPANYTVLIADGLNDIMAYISAYFRPSGILIKPAEYSTAEKIFNDIYADYKKRGGEKGSQFRFKIRSREYSVNADSILYFEALNKKVMLRTAGQTFEFYMPMDEILKNLPKYFARIHKSYIVNTRHIAVADYKNMTVTLNDNSTVFISRTYKGNLQSAMNEIKKGKLK